MSYKETAERLEHKFKRMNANREEVADRAIATVEFIGGVAASSAYRAYLTKNSKAMPKVGGIDADTLTGATLLALSFLEVLPAAYASHALYVGAGLVSGSVGNKVAGLVNPAQATKGFFNSGEDPHQLGAGDTSADRGADILRMVRQHARLPRGKWLQLT